MLVKKTSSRPAFYFVVVLTSAAPLFGQATAESIPVLTVCEALRDLKLYNGKDVMIVGRSAWTFEGTFLSEHCEPDGRTMVQGEARIKTTKTCQEKSPCKLMYDCLLTIISELFLYYGSSIDTQDSDRPIKQGLAAGFECRR